MSSTGPKVVHADNVPLEVRQRRWLPDSPQEVQWEDLTNEEIVVLANRNMIHWVVLPNKEDGDKATLHSKAEVDKIGELFIDFDKSYESDGMLFKVHYYFNINLDPKTGKKYSSDERVEAMSKLLWSHINDRISRYGWKQPQNYSGTYFVHVCAELPTGFKSSVAATSHAPSDEPPTVQVTRRFAWMDGSKVGTDDSHK